MCKAHTKIHIILVDVWMCSNPWESFSHYLSIHPHAKSFLFNITKIVQDLGEKRATKKEKFEKERDRDREGEWKRDKERMR